MGWFSKSSGDFFLSTVVPQGQGGAQVAQFLGLVNGEAVIGANIFRDVFSSVRDVVGGRAGGYERALAGAREAALDDMKAAARALGANGIVGIDFDYEVLGETNGMMLVSVSGTAVTMVRLALPWAGRPTATSWLPLARSAARRRCQGLRRRLGRPCCSDALPR